MSALHKKAPKIVVAVLRDAKLWVARPTLSLPSSETEKGTDLTTASETRGVSDGQNIRQSREGSSARHAAEQSCRLIFLFRELLNLIVASDW